MSYWTCQIPMRAAVLHRLHEPLVVKEVDVEPPHAGEVLVRLAASGVCRSDMEVKPRMSAKSMVTSRLAPA